MDAANIFRIASDLSYTGNRLENIMQQATTLYQRRHRVLRLRQLAIQDGCHVKEKQATYILRMINERTESLNR